MSASNQQDEDSPPPLVDDEEILENEESDNDQDEEPMDFFEGDCKDLFSDKLFKTPGECLDHCKRVHGFDLATLKDRHNLDCFSFIKLVNYIRKEKPTPESVMAEKTSKLWNSDEFMKPVLENDPLLMFDIEEDLEETNGVELEEDAVAAIADLKKDVAEMKVKYDMMERMIGILPRLDAFKELLSEDNKKENVKKMDVASRIKESEDGSYAGSYSHFSIHHEMLSDRVRTEAYRDAIYNNKDQIRNKKVLDLGCGTGILSMFCASAGAKSVTGVDMSDIIHDTNEIVRENGLENKIKLVKGRLEDVEELKGEKFDILVSEWMGYFLLYEGMLDSVISARDKYLNPGGVILPNICTMHLFAIADEERYNKTIDFWQDVYGFKMSCMKKPVLTEASVEIVPSDKIASNPCEILKLDLTTCQLEDFADFEKDFKLQVTEDCQITAIGGYFDSVFGQFKNEVVFTTGPQGEPTHWKQTLFYLSERVNAVKGQVFDGKIRVFRPAKDPRSLSIKLDFAGQKHVYEMC